MKKRLLTMLTLCSCAVLLASCRASADTRTGQADGYGGILRVQVMMEDGAISAVNILEQHETDGIGSRALDILPDEMIRMNTWDVDVVTGATMTSNALREAVRVALNASDTMDEATGNPANRAGQAIREGIGMAATGRVGPGKDDEDGQVYSFNVVFAHGTFDEDGRIVSMAVDQLEVATPNYSGASMPQFSGFPGQGGYSLWDDSAGKVVGYTEDSEDNYMQEIAAWTSKRARGEDYQLTSGSWREQMDAYQNMMVGMTVDEVETWFGRYFSAENGRPLTENSSSDADRARWEAFSDDDRARAADQDCRRNTQNIPRAERAGKRRRQGLKCGKSPAALRAAQCPARHARQLCHLHEPPAQREPHARKQNQKQHVRPPQNRCQNTDKRREALVHSAQFISRYAHTARVSASAITVILFLIHASSSALSWYAISTRTAGALVFVISARRVVATVLTRSGSG